MSDTTPVNNISASSPVEATLEGTAHQGPSDTGTDGMGSDETSEAYIRKQIAESSRLKQEGTEAFRAKQWAQARATYSMALARLPKRVKEPTHEPFDGAKFPKPGDRVQDMEGDNKESDENGDKKDRSDKGKERDVSKPPLTGIELECAKARAVLNANIGACYVNQEKYEEGVKACSEALEDDPTYVKAIQRRATSNDKIGTWSALSSAQEDYNTLLKLLPPDSSQVATTKRALQTLKPRLEAAQKKETAEMIDKMKGLGNSILGNFGLSTDNFKFEPNGQGGYSLNFVR